MMKILLAISLVTNLILGVLYFQEKNKPPLERIVLEKAPEQIVVEPKVKTITEIIHKEKNEVPVMRNSDDESFRLAAEDMEQAKRDFFDANEFSEEIIEKKQAVVDEYTRETQKIYRKNFDSGVSMGLKDQRKLLELEENLYKTLESLYGPKKWQKYKAFVDNYNKKMFEKQKAGEGPALMMSY